MEMGRGLLLLSLVGEEERGRGKVKRDKRIGRASGGEEEWEWEGIFERGEGGEATLRVVVVVGSQGGYGLRADRVWLNGQSPSVCVCAVVGSGALYILGE